MTNLTKLIETNTVTIIAGEGVGGGTAKTFNGARTLRAIKMRLKKERCNGDRWAFAHVYSHTNEYCAVFVDIETGEYASEYLGAYNA